jgi:hypothetical protein
LADVDIVMSEENTGVLPNETSSAKALIIGVNVGTAKSSSVIDCTPMIF